MSESQEHYDVVVEDTNGNREPQRAKLTAWSRTMIGLLAVVLGGGSGIGGGYIGVQISQARTAEIVKANRESIKEAKVKSDALEDRTTEAIAKAEERLTDRIESLEAAIENERTERQADAQRVQRTLGRIEGMLRSLDGSRWGPGSE